MASKKKVLVVDDSALMRKHLRAILEADGRFEVYTARDGQDALDHLAEVNPDVVTLDINMPVMDGITCLSHIMATHPLPVVMVSSLTEKGALATFEALELGAVDFIPKPGGTVSHNIKDIAEGIIQKLLSATGSRMVGAGSRARQQARGARAVPSPAAKRTSPPPPIPRAKTRRVPIHGARVARGLVLIGVSTGGPGTLEEILPLLPAEFPLPVLVAQHMPASFTGVFANRMAKLCPLPVIELDRPTPLEPGKIMIARGDSDVVVARTLGRRIAQNVPANPDFLWHPSVERMVASAMEFFKPEELIAVQLTGMGNDGAPAMAELRGRGGHTIAESEETAVVFGMPKELVALGGAEIVLPMDQIARQLLSWT